MAGRPAPPEGDACVAPTACLIVCVKMNHRILVSTHRRHSCRARVSRFRTATRESIAPRAVVRWSRGSRCGGSPAQGQPVPTRHRSLVVVRTLRGAGPSCRHTESTVHGRRSFDSRGCGRASSARSTPRLAVRPTFAITSPRTVVQSAGHEGTPYAPRGRERIRTSCP